MKLNLSRHRLIVNFMASFCLYISTIRLCTGCGGITTFVPIVVTMRDSLDGEGKVAIFSNQTPNQLTITVTVENKPKNQRQSVNIDLDPNENREFGWLEGWRFLCGVSYKPKLLAHITCTRTPKSNAKIDTEVT